MTFDKEYKRLADCVKTDIECFEKFFHSMFFEDEEIEKVLTAYLSGNGRLKGKLIRPVLIFLFTRACGIAPEKAHFQLAFCDEMLHNASLIHDDIIDNSETRRGVPTLNNRFDCRFAVIAGDYLLAKAIEALSGIGNTEIIQIHADCIKKLISGESKQYFSRYDALSLSDYIKKSENKTAALFQAALASVSVLNGGHDLSEFAKNFGIAFQIHNDLKNFQADEKMSDDVKNGIYTAPVIFYLEKFKNINEIANYPDKAYFVEKTRLLIQDFADKAIENISCLEDNQYKRAVIDLCKLYSQG